jgi:hypothetical protein
VRIFINLERDELDRLRDLARAERRTVQDQAALLVVQGLGGTVGRAQPSGAPDAEPRSEVVPA